LDEKNNEEHIANLHFSHERERMWLAMNFQHMDLTDKEIMFIPIAIDLNDDLQQFYGKPWAERFVSFLFSYFVYSSSF